MVPRLACSRHCESVFVGFYNGPSAVPAFRLFTNNLLVSVNAGLQQLNGDGLGVRGLAQLGHFTGVERVVGFDDRQLAFIRRFFQDGTLGEQFLCDAVHVIACREVKTCRACSCLPLCRRQQSELRRLPGSLEAATRLDLVIIHGQEVQHPEWAYYLESWEPAWRFPG
jgi:hypothetical protein